METNFTKPTESLIPPVNSLDSAKTLTSAPPNCTTNLSSNSSDSTLPSNSSDSTLPKSELSNYDNNLNETEIVDLDFDANDFSDLAPITSVSPLWSEPCQEIEDHKVVEVELPLSLSVGVESQELSSDLSLPADSKVAASDMALVSGFKPAIVGAGLANLGNTCFLNAVMQCFTHTVPLLMGIIACRHKFPCYVASVQGFCVLCALIEHAHLSLTCRLVAPWALVNNLKYFSTYFDKYQQEDAHEFLQCFLDKLENCWNDSKLNDISLQGSNIVQLVFGGCLVSKLRCCNCGHCSDTYEPLIDVSLEIENADTLSGALESFTKVERIGDSETTFTCENCNEQVFVEKQLMLDQAPSVAAFHLKRFKNDGCLVEKIDKFVAFPLELDLLPYTAGCQTQSAQLKYDLYAVVVHVGYSSNSGHYYCFIQSAPHVWYKLDDEQVIWVEEEFVLSHEAYILFYAKKGTPGFSSFMEMRKQAMDIAIRNTSPKSVLVDIDACSSSPSMPLECQSDGHKTCDDADFASTLTLAIENSEESRNVEFENKENFMPVSTPCVTSSPPVVLPINDSDSQILKENNSSHVPEVINLGNVTPPMLTRSPPMLTRSPSPEIYKEDSDQHFSVPHGHSKSADQVYCKRQQFSIPHGSKSADHASCKRQLNRELESIELKQACALIKKSMPGSRGQQLLAALGGSLSEGSANKKRARTIQQLPDTEDRNSCRKGNGQSNPAGSFR